LAIEETIEENRKNALNYICPYPEPKKILLYITTYGGTIYCAFHIIDIIESMKVPVHTICIGHVASAGTLISLAGEKRFITKNTTMLIHEISNSLSRNKYTNLVESMENIKKRMEQVKTYYTKKTKMTLEELEYQLKKDEHWYAETC
jgi:ATP-dependent Clp protease protease subunit